MLWGEAQDKSLLTYTANLIAARRAHPALVDGAITSHVLDDARGLWLLERRAGGDCVLVAINIAGTEQVIDLPPGAYAHLDGAAAAVSVTAPPVSVTLLTGAGA